MVSLRFEIYRSLAKRNRTLKDYYNKNVNRMGQFLAIGLAHEIVTSRDEIRKKNISNEELRQEIEQTLVI